MKKRRVHLPPFKVNLICRKTVVYNVSTDTGKSIRTYHTQGIAALPKIIESHVREMCVCARREFCDPFAAMYHSVKIVKP